VYDIESVYDTVLFEGHYFICNLTIWSHIWHYFIVTKGVGSLVHIYGPICSVIWHTLFNLALCSVILYGTLYLVLHFVQLYGTLCSILLVLESVWLRRCVMPFLL
jgi:hypothetical protein